MESNTKPTLLDRSFNDLFKVASEIKSFDEFFKPKVEYIYHIDDFTTVEVYDDKTIKEVTFIYDNEYRENYECHDTFTEKVFRPGSNGYDDIKKKLNFPI